MLMMQMYGGRVPLWLIQLGSLEWCFCVQSGVKVSM